MSKSLYFLWLKFLFVQYISLFLALFDHCLVLFPHLIASSILDISLELVRPLCCKMFLCFIICPVVSSNDRCDDSWDDQYASDNIGKQCAFVVAQVHLYIRKELFCLDVIKLHEL